MYISKEFKLVMLERLAEMTWRNPIFMFVLFGALWFLPGLLYRRYLEVKSKKNKEEEQIKKIARLYPKSSSNIDSGQ